MSPEAIDGRLREVSDLYQLCLSLMSAKRLGTVAEVRERDRLEKEVRAQGLDETTDSPQEETAP